jgi:chromosome partitioning protein
VKVICLASTKGGSGKSTLAECLAVEAVRTGSSVYLCDLDPQQSTASWWRRRKGPAEPMLITGVDTASAAIRALQKRKAERDYLIVDSPGSFMAVVNDALMVADCAIVVVQPSIKDLEAQGAVEGLIRKLGKTPSTMYVLNRADKRYGVLAAALDVIEKKSLNPVPIIRNLADYAKADQIGKCGNEINHDAAAEISDLWEKVKKIAHAERKTDERAHELRN